MSTHHMDMDKLARPVGPATGQAAPAAPGMDMGLDGQRDAYAAGHHQTYADDDAYAPRFTVGQRALGLAAAGLLCVGLGYCTGAQQHTTSTALTQATIIPPKPQPAFNPMRPTAPGITQSDITVTTPDAKVDVRNIETAPLPTGTGCVRLTPKGKDGQGYVAQMEPADCDTPTRLQDGEGSVKDTLPAPKPSRKKVEAPSATPQSWSTDTTTTVLKAPARQAYYPHRETVSPIVNDSRSSYPYGYGGGYGGEYRGYAGSGYYGDSGRNIFGGSGRYSHSYGSKSSYWEKTRAPGYSHYARGHHNESGSIKRRHGVTIQKHRYEGSHFSKERVSPKYYYGGNTYHVPKYHGPAHHAPKPHNPGKPAFNKDRGGGYPHR